MPRAKAGGSTSRRLTRADLDRFPSIVLSDKGERAPRVTLYELPRGRLVLKEWSPDSGRIHQWYSRWLIRREIRNYRLLKGTPGIPRLLGSIGDRGFLLEFIEARHMRKLPERLYSPGLDSLEQVLGQLHARRFVHLDVRKRGNVLIDKGGKAWLIDLGQGLDCSKGVIRRLLFPFLRRIDNGAVLKCRAIYVPETLDPKVRDRLVAQYQRRGIRWVSVIGRLLLRILVRDQKVPVYLRPRKRSGGVFRRT